MGIGYWVLDIVDWRLRIEPNPQSLIPNPQSPIPNYTNIFYFSEFKLINSKKNKNCKKIKKKIMNLLLNLLFLKLKIF